MSDEKNPVEYKINPDADLSDDESNSDVDDKTNIAYLQPIQMYKDLLLPQAVQLFLSSIENKNEEQAIALLDKEEIQAFVKAHLNEPIN